MPIIRSVPLCLIAVLASCALAQEVPGLAKEQPKDGPFVKTDKGFMVTYKQTLPGTDITFEMIPIAGGEFLMGSPSTEPDRNEDEGPQVRVKIEPFWMSKYELTWREYKQFMSMYSVFKDFATNPKRDKDGQIVTAPGPDGRPAPVAQPIRPVTKDNIADAVTTPTPLYDPEKTFERGQEDNEPAVTMTPFAARQYTKWLSLQLGQFYRLPSEAEWEYACRGGTQTAYSFGNDPKGLDEHAWHFLNSIKKDLDLEAYHAVGSKKPNPWGLYDMHGNVSELVLDQYIPDHYKKFEGKTVTWQDAIAWPTKRVPRVHRGGSWNSDPKDCRSATRGQTDDETWKTIDPNRPKSPWWYTEEEARAVGMRIMRPLKEPMGAVERNRYWEEQDVPEVVEDVKRRLDEGRGVLAPVDPQLPRAIESFKKK